MVKNPARKDGTTATMQYERHRTDIARLIDILEAELDRHAKKQAGDYRNWSLAGDLGKVRSDLIDALAFISGNDRKFVTDFLKEAAE